MSTHHQPFQTTDGDDRGEVPSGCPAGGGCTDIYSLSIDMGKPQPLNEVQPRDDAVNPRLVNHFQSEISSIDKMNLPQDCDVTNSIDGSDDLFSMSHRHAATGSCPTPPDANNVNGGIGDCDARKLESLCGYIERLYLIWDLYEDKDDLLHEILTMRCQESEDTDMNEKDIADMSSWSEDSIKITRRRLCGHSLQQ
jgi:hypothetical protein